MAKPKALESKLEEHLQTKDPDLEAKPMPFKFPLVIAGDIRPGGKEKPLDVQDFSIFQPGKKPGQPLQMEKYSLPKPEKDLVTMNAQEYQSYLEKIRKEMADQGFSEEIVQQAEGFVEKLRHPVYLKQELKGPPLPRQQAGDKLQSTFSLEIVYDKDGQPTTYKLEVDQGIKGLNQDQYQEYVLDVKEKLRKQGVPEEYDQLVEQELAKARAPVTLTADKPSLFTPEKLEKELETIAKEKEFLERLKKEGGAGVREAVEEALEKIGAEEKELRAYQGQVAERPRTDIKIPKGGSVTSEIVKQIETQTGKRLSAEEARSLFYEAILPDNPDLKAPGKPGVVKGEWSPQTGWDLVQPGQEFSFALGEKTQKWFESHEISFPARKQEKPLKGKEPKVPKKETQRPPAEEILIEKKEEEKALEEEIPREETIHQAELKRIEKMKKREKAKEEREKIKVSEAPPEEIERKEPTKPSQKPKEELVREPTDEYPSETRFLEKTPSKTEKDRTVFEPQEASPPTLEERAKQALAEPPKPEEKPAYSAQELSSYTKELASRLEQALETRDKDKEKFLENVLVRDPGQGIKAYQMIFEDPYFKQAPEKAKKQIIETTFFRLFDPSTRSQTEVTETAITYGLLLNKAMEKGQPFPKTTQALNEFIREEKRQSDFAFVAQEAANSIITADMSRLTAAEALAKIPDIQSPGKTFDFLIQKGFFTKEDLESFHGKTLDELKKMGKKGQALHTIIYGDSRSRSALVNASDHIDHYFSTYIMREGGGYSVQSYQIKAKWKEVTTSLEGINWQEVEKLPDLSRLSPQEMVSQYQGGLNQELVAKYLIDQGLITKSEILERNLIGRDRQGETKNALKFWLSEAKTTADYQKAVNVLEKKGEALFDQYSHTHLRRAPWRFVTDLLGGSVQEAVQYPTTESIFWGSIDVITAPFLGLGKAPQLAGKAVAREAAEQVAKKTAKEVAEAAAREGTETIVKKTTKEGAEKATETVAKKGEKGFIERAVDTAVAFFNRLLGREAGQAEKQFFKQFETKIGTRYGKQGEILGKEVAVKIPGLSEEIKIPTELLANTPQAQTEFRKIYDDILREVLADRAAARGMKIQKLNPAGLDRLLDEEFKHLPKETQEALMQITSMEVIGQKGVERMTTQAGEKGVKDFRQEANKIIKATEAQRQAERKALEEEAKRKAKLEAAEALKKGQKTRLIDRLTVGAKTDVGQTRAKNEDFFAHPSWAKVAYNIPDETIDARGALYAVADGMGGAQAGEVASREATGQLYRAYYLGSGFNEPGVTLRQAFNSANQEVYYLAQRPEYRTMGTTLTGAVIKDKELIIGHIGDSRAYLVRQGKIFQLTNDHTFAEELVRMGKITKEEAATYPNRHILTKAVGAEPDESADILRYQLQKGDKIILTTDGLTGLISDSEILKTVSQSKPQQATEQLIRLANQKGGYDNITALVVEYGG